jgi:hypothetical protein
MRVVLYADDMEPITVIDLPEFAEGYITKHGMVRLAVQMPPMLSALMANQAPSFTDGLRTVTIFGERFIRHGREQMMLFTRDEESALLLKCAFLPGQQSELQQRERGAFARGFLDALMRAGGA